MIFRLEASLSIEEVVVTANNGSTGLLSSQLSIHNLNSLNVKDMPILLGETDFIKALQYMPGVSSGMEGTSGIYVRGGGADQNLVLLDDVPVYNMNHLFGFFSVFNGEAVNSATLYKGGFPARYSGRLSSVLDVRMKEGNNKEFHGNASVGIISSSIMLEGPIIKDRTSFLISARRTYIDVLSYPVQYLINLEEVNKELIGYYFYDLNAKINHRFSDRSRLYLSSYLGKDEFYMNNEYSFYTTWNDVTYTMTNKSRDGFNWGNISNSVRWNYSWGSRFFSNLTFYHTKYLFNNFEKSFYPEFFNPLTQEIDRSGMTTTENYYSSIRDLALKADFTFIPNPAHTIRFGIKGDSYFFEPGVASNTSTGTSSIYGSTEWGNTGDSVYAAGITVYAEDDFSIGERFKANLGLSSTMFNVEGHNYISLEPRVSARFMLSDQLALKASYAEMSQHVHLLTNSSIGLPTDIWVPSTSYVPPEESWQAVLGLQTRFRGDWEFSVEGFYKEMDNMVEYSEGVDMLLMDNTWETRIEIGSGRAYGVEFFTEKTKGTLTGSLAYTLSKNTRQFENINNGDPFPFKYDRRHEISLVVNYNMKEGVRLGAVWVYGTGTNITIQDQSYINPYHLYENYNRSVYDYGSRDLIKSYEARNSFQLEDYHRLDMGINFDKNKGKYTRTWSFGAYNAYNRKNAFGIYMGLEKNTESNEYETHVYKTTLFPIMPYVRYSIKF